MVQELKEYVVHVPARLVWGSTVHHTVERAFLMRFAVDASSAEGAPSVGWTAELRLALRLTRAQASGAALLLDLPDDVRIDRPNKGALQP